MNRIVAVALSCVLAVSAFAALSPENKEWGAGPAQWIMTPDEQRAWRKITTDEEATKFIALFWARRDTTPANEFNEFRNEFDSRVQYADEHFGEKRKRGAMTDRGRVYITLGNPTTMNGVLGQAGGQMGAASADNDMSGARQTSTRHVWVWDQKDARKFDMGRVEVMFVEDPITHRVQRDPTRADFGRAGPVAIQKAIVNPGLTAPPTYETITVPMAETPAPAPEVSTPVVDAKPAVASSTPGLSRLTFGPVDLHAADPLAVASSDTFSGKDVPWAAQFCSAKAETPRLTFMLFLSGPMGEQRTKQKEAKLTPVASRPGCYVLQGVVPVSKLKPGRYKASVLVDDVVTGDPYSVKRDFAVQ